MGPPERARRPLRRGRAGLRLARGPRSGYHTIETHDSANGNARANAHTYRPSCPGSHRTYTTGDCLGGTLSQGNGSEDHGLNHSLLLHPCRYKDTADALDQRLTTVEDQMSTLPDQETEFRSLRTKVTDLEDRSRRDNMRLFVIAERKEGSVIKAFLQSLLPDLFGIEFSPPLEFQRAHRIGPPHKATSDKPRPIIACFLRHDEARQVLSAAKTQGPASLDGHEIRVAADFSRRMKSEKRS
ncbi:hypothetical protein NDU88_006552 [Pleurodeles waltl]|uniref:L1 transposable element RRM domain-containing protein n=1 Tax=Pleurodeles waltl TaxID=8319 RepID=A0AAV7X1E8_PLEWA|nr:hypothetical protein NDU88_006552 [Pleurodeles waltl]